MTMDGQQGEGVNTTPSETKSLWPIPFYLFTLINIKSKFLVCSALLWLLPPSIFVPVFPASLCCGKEQPGGQGWAQALSPSLSSLSLSLSISASQNYNHSFGSTHHAYCHDPASNVQRLTLGNLFTLDSKEQALYISVCIIVFIFWFIWQTKTLMPSVSCRICEYFEWGRNGLIVSSLFLITHHACHECQWQPDSKWRHNPPPPFPETREPGITPGASDRNLRA